MFFHQYIFVCLRLAQLFDIKSFCDCWQVFPSPFYQNSMSSDWEKLCWLRCINRKSNAGMSIRLLVNITVCYDYLSLPDLLEQHLYCNILMRVFGSAGQMFALFIDADDYDCIMHNLARNWLNKGNRTSNSDWLQMSEAINVWLDLKL